MFVTWERGKEESYEAEEDVGRTHGGGNDERREESVVLDEDFRNARSRRMGTQVKVCPRGRQVTTIV